MTSLHVHTPCLLVQQSTMLCAAVAAAHRTMVSLLLLQTTRATRSRSPTDSMRVTSSHAHTPCLLAYQKTTGFTVIAAAAAAAADNQGNPIQITNRFYEGDKFRPYLPACLAENLVIGAAAAAPAWHQSMVSVCCCCCCCRALNHVITAAAAASCRQPGRSDPDHQRLL
jgi:hypothetical protein